MRRALLFAMVISMLLASCKAGTAPRWTYDSSGQPAVYKRYPRHMAVDYVNRFRRTAYLPVKQPITEYLSDEQRRWISEYGQPDYRRRLFRERNGEKVDEWIYLAQNKVVQFIHGRVVYEGPVTDLEKTLIRLGYPSGCSISQNEPSVERFNLTYGRFFDLEREVISLAGDQIVFRQKMR
ncbi:MAG: hypothetical protein N3D11_08455 [Candidatus Sumerlaeia bacterium]|nr:hypothetical protein [Candidatus Sumerlaeia bacterium]